MKMLILGYLQDSKYFIRIETQNTLNNYSSPFND